MSNSSFTINLSDIVAVEALTPDQMKVMGAETKNSMLTGIVTDKMIQQAGLKPVTDPIMFMKGYEPTDGGLFSEKIFGETAEQKKRQFAYIDLGEKFFHPFVYEILFKLNRKIREVVAGGQGQWSWKIVKGDLVKVPKGDPKYDEDNDGLRWLVKHFDELEFKKNKSNARNDRVDLLKNLTKDEIFISKWLVCPIIYRDVVISASGKRDVPDLDKLYEKLIRYSNSLKGDFFSFFNINSLCAIQETLYTIRQFGQNLVKGKHGHYHKAILGKSIDRGSRDVISPPVLNYYERPEDNPIDIFHSGIPLVKCLIMGYDFIMRYCITFFENNFKNVMIYPLYKEDKSGKYVIDKEIPIKNQLEVFNVEYLNKKIKRYMNSPGTRFEKIMIEAEDGKKIPIHFSGLFRPMKDSPMKVPQSIVNRPMTWTDLFYRAAMDTLNDKHVYITRHPVTSYNSIFPSLCLPISTLETIPVEIDGILYKNYPYIDLSKSVDDVSTMFIDTVAMSNLFLSALNGDFDGDTVISKLTFSLEANEEADRLMMLPSNYISANGSLMRVLGNETYFTFFVMTNH